MINEQTFRAHMMFSAQIFVLLKVREHGGNNKGEVVETFLRAQDGYAGQPWCVAFVAWIFEAVCKVFGLKSRINVNLSCTDTINKAKAVGAVRSSAKDAKTGDFLVLKDTKGYYHICIVAHPVDSVGNIATFEGNTNAAGSAEGDGVYKKTRHYTQGDVINSWALVAA